MKLAVLFSILFLSLSGLLVSCGKKTTIQNFSTNPFSNFHNETSQPNPDVGGTDSAGGDVLGTNHALVYELFSDEKKFRSFAGSSLDRFLLAYQNTTESHSLFTQFLLKLDQSLNFNCTQDLLKKNSEAYQNEFSFLNSNLQLIDILQEDVPQYFLPQKVANNPQHFHDFSKYLNYLNERKQIAPAFGVTPNPNQCLNLFKNFLNTVVLDIRNSSSCSIQTEHSSISKNASYSKSQSNSIICISALDLAHKLTGQELEQILGLLVHEIAHHLDFSEAEAVSIQKFLIQQSPIVLDKNLFDSKDSTEFHLNTTSFMSEIISFIEIAPMLNKLFHRPDEKNLYQIFMKQLNPTMLDDPFFLIPEERVTNFLEKVKLYKAYYSSILKQDLSIQGGHTKNRTFQMQALSKRQQDLLEQVSSGLISVSLDRHYIRQLESELEKGPYQPTPPIPEGAIPMPMDPPTLILNINETMKRLAIVFDNLKRDLVLLHLSLPAVVANSFYVNMFYENLQVAPEPLSYEQIHHYLKHSTQGQSINTFDFSNAP